MTALNKNYITSQFKFPDTNTVVIVDGEYQPQLSDLPRSIFADRTLNIPKNTKLKTPIHLLFLTTKSCRNVMDIVIERGSYTTIIEEYASLGDQIYTNDVKVNIDACAHSELVHYKLQFEGAEQAIYQAETNINQAEDSKITSYFINKGAKLATDNLLVKLLGKRASYQIQGINLLSDQQDMTHQIRVEHLEPNCTSNILSKGVIDDQAINNFICRIIANSNAIKTETHVTNKNLLLSEQAIANASPELEVYVDDVICTHGATVGSLDQEALFYLRSRGLAKSIAIKILTQAFIQEILERFMVYPRYKIAAGLTYA